LKNSFGEFTSKKQGVLMLYKRFSRTADAFLVIPFLQKRPFSTATLVRDSNPYRVRVGHPGTRAGGAQNRVMMMRSHVAPMSTNRSTQPDRVFRFGPFELSEREAELRKNGVRIKLQEQPFRVLAELVANAGRMVTREDLQQKLWPSDTFVDFEVGLNSIVRKLRQALNDDADHPHYIETLAKRGYRFLAPVTDTGAKGSELRSQPVSDAALTVEGFPEGKGESVTRAKAASILTQRRTRIAAAAAVVAIAGALVFWWTRPPTVPIVEAVTQLTDDGEPKSSLHQNRNRRGACLLQRRHNRKSQDYTGRGDRRPSSGRPYESCGSIYRGTVAGRFCPACDIP